MTQSARLAAAAAVALLLAACSDEEIERAEIPVGATFVSRVISRDLVESNVPDSSLVTVTLTSDSTLTADLPPNTCFLAFARTDLATWAVDGGGGCTEACCSTQLAEEIVDVLAAGDFSLDEGTLTARAGRTAVIFD